MTDRQSNQALEILRHAATLVVIRVASPGFEVLLMRRADKGDRNSGAWVFPGGLVDRADHLCHPYCTGLDDAAASHRLGVARGGLDYYVAAIRETFEEAGLLFAVGESGERLGVDGVRRAYLSSMRGPLNQGNIEFAAVCQTQRLRLAAHMLHYIAHWITPVGMPKRFDTRFFLAVFADEQLVEHDNAEVVEHGWFNPASLLADPGERRLLGVTRSTLKLMSGFGTLEALMRWAASPRVVKTMLRRRCRDAAGAQTVLPDHPAWAEIGLLDPQGKGLAWCELRIGERVRLSPFVQRLTHAGGNTYLVGDIVNGWVVIDPRDSEQMQKAMMENLDNGTPTVVMTGQPVSAEPIHLGESLTLKPIATPDGTGWLLVEERMAFMGRWRPPQSESSIALRASADWIAPREGFLIQLI
ncbi:NUDIX domain-containing protein [Variovorax paradoxus]|nr:NUDIX domain-containing protein [Variovorax paradoxus]MBT2302518.1 NUDIX domain-containing protein [Variovorax paradoxus]